MSEETDSVADLCCDHLVERKWLLAPSLTIGTQWIEYLARQGVPCVNLLPTTLDVLADEVSRPLLASRKLIELPAEIHHLVLMTGWDRLPTDGYFRRLPASPGVLRSLTKTVQDLRLHNISPDEVAALNSGNLDSNRLTELASLLADWISWLDQHSMVDRAALLKIARDEVSRQSPSLTELLLIPEQMELFGIEKQFVRSFPKEQVFRVDSPLNVVSHIEAGDSKSTDLGLHFFRAVGKRNEARGILRLCAENDYRLDEVEVLSTDTSALANTLLDILPCSTGEDPFSQVTFEDGLPIVRSRPARALLGMIEWVNADFGVRELCRLLENDLIDCRKAWGPSLVRVLLSLGVKSGLENYLPRLRIEIENVRKSLAENTLDDETDALRRQRQLQQLESLLALLDRLLPIVIQIRGNGVSSFQAVQKLINELLVIRDAIDRAAAAHLTEALQRQIEWQQSLSLQIDALPWLESILGDASILRSGPKPGRIHVSSIFGGGQSGRGVCFVSGMTDDQFPGRIRQDPALSDDDRIAFDREVPTGAAKHASRLWLVQNLLGQLRGDVWVSWAATNAEDGSSAFPSSLVHSLARMAIGGDPADWSQDDLLEITGPSLSYAVTGTSSAFSSTDQLASSLLKADADTSSLEQHFPCLVAGMKSQKQRLRSFGEWSGDVSELASLPEPSHVDPVYSASGLETLGRCPLAFFFSRRLKGYRDDEFDWEPERWLSPAAFGRLVHELFQRFLSGFTKGDNLSFERHWQELRELVVTICEEYTGLFPPPSASSFRHDVARIVRIARTFLQEESVWYREHKARPAYCEATLGMSPASGAIATPLDTVAPISVVLPSGRRIFGRGQIDRIDAHGNSRFAVCDYKTGGAYGFSLEDPVQGGRRLQSVLYVKMVQAVLREKVNADAFVVRFDYFFPGVRADGLRIGWDAVQLEGSLEAVDTLVQLDDGRTYPATNNVDDCRFCDYARVCGDVRQVAQSADASYRTDVRLADLKGLRDGEAR